LVNYVLNGTQASGIRFNTISCDISCIIKNSPRKVVLLDLGVKICNTCNTIRFLEFADDVVLLATNEILKRPAHRTI